MDLADLAKVPMREERDLRMVEIIVLKWRCPAVEMKCAEHILRHTEWPFKLVMYDNRPNTPNTSRIWNKLIRQATCDYVCILDSDAFVQPSDPCWLTRMMETFTTHPDAKVVVPMTDRCAYAPQCSRQAAQYPSAERNDGIWSGFCFLMRRNLIDDLGPFDEEFVGYGQDSEFAARLARLGRGTYIRRDVWVQHLHGASFKKATTTGEHDAAADRTYAQRLFHQKTGKQ